MVRVAFSCGPSRPSPLQEQNRSSDDGDDHASAKRNNNNNNNLEKEKQSYRMTPHPSSKHPSDLFLSSSSSTDQHAPMFPTPTGKEMDAVICNVPSPEAGSSILSDDAAVAMQEQGDELHALEASSGLSPPASAEDDEWQQWLDTMSSKGNLAEECPNLEIYLAAKESREDAKRGFEQSLGECLQEMAQAMTVDLLEDTIGVVFREQSSRFERLEANIIELMLSNHERRTALNNKVEYANATWNHQYKKMKNAISNSEQEDSDEKPAPVLAGEEFVRSDIYLASDDMISDGKASATDDGQSENADDGSNEPDWDKIAEFEPSRKNVQSFLATREKLRFAEEALVHAIDVIHGELKADADEIEQVVIAAYNQLEQKMLEMEHDVQYHLMNNHLRRNELERRIQEWAKQTQVCQANFMSQLRGGR